MPLPASRSPLHRYFATWVAALLCTAALAASGANAAEIRLEATEFIEVQADGKHCLIRRIRLLCADAITHLRNELKLARGAMVGVKAHQAAPHSSVKQVLADVGNSEFRHPVARVQEPKDNKGK